MLIVNEPVGVQNSNKTRRRNNPRASFLPDPDTNAEVGQGNEEEEDV